MQDKTPRDGRTRYTGRFADPAQSAPPRSSSPARPRAAAPDAVRRRPTGFAETEPPKRRPAQPAKPAQQAKPERKTARGRKPAPEPKPGREKPARNKRGARGSAGSKKLRIALIALAVLIVAIVALALIFGGNGGTYHQLPKVERGGDSAYEPKDTVAPAAETAAPVAKQPSMPEEGAADALPEADGLEAWGEQGDAGATGDAGELDALGDLAGAEDLSGLDELSGEDLGDLSAIFGEGEDIDASELDDLDDLSALLGDGDAELDAELANAFGEGGT